jgi:hypothetical protein
VRNFQQWQDFSEGEQADSFCKLDQKAQTNDTAIMHQDVVVVADEDDVGFDGGVVDWSKSP